MRLLLARSIRAKVSRTQRFLVAFILALLTVLYVTQRKPLKTEKEDEADDEIELKPTDCIITCEQDDRRLPVLIKKNHIRKPTHPTLSASSEFYNKDIRDVDFGEAGLPQLVDKLLNGKREGFFVEAGAFDGGLSSNSLFFELKRNWTGLLIEPIPSLYEQLVSTGRNALTMNVAVALAKWSQDEELYVASNNSGVVGAPTSFDIIFERVMNVYEKGRETVWVKSFPLYSILVALGNPEVDYLSLDISGPELIVLKTVPWDRVRVKVISVDCQGEMKLFSKTLLYMSEEVKEFFVYASIDERYLVYANVNYFDKTTKQERLLDKTF